MSQCYTYYSCVIVTVFAKTRSKKQGVKRLGYDQFEVAVNQPPIEGRANKAIIKALAKHLGIASIDIELVAGHAHKIKRLAVPDNCLPSWPEQEKLLP